CGCASPDEEPSIACTLGAADIPGRMAAWRTALATVVAREPIEDGVRLQFGPNTVIGELAELAAAEQDCCMFFRFTLTIDTRGIALEVTAPPQAVDAVHTLFG